MKRRRAPLDDDDLALVDAGRRAADRYAELADTTHGTDEVPSTVMAAHFRRLARDARTAAADLERDGAESIVPRLQLRRAVREALGPEVEARWRS